jgi:hypothetical protein
VSHTFEYDVVDLLEQAAQVLLALLLRLLMIWPTILQPRLEFVAHLLSAPTRQQHTALAHSTRTRTRTRDTTRHDTTRHALFKEGGLSGDCGLLVLLLLLLRAAAGAARILEHGVVVQQLRSGDARGR